MKFHIHWHRRQRNVAHGLFLQPVFKCRCGSTMFGCYY